MTSIAGRKTMDMWVLVEVLRELSEAFWGQRVEHPLTIQAAFRVFEPELERTADNDYE